MGTPAAGAGARAVVFDRAGFQVLLDVLVSDGYRVVGPRVRGGAVVLDDVARVEDLPAGWTDRQAPGTYRLEPAEAAPRGERAEADGRDGTGGALFGYAAGPQSWKRFVFPPRAPRWRARRVEGDGGGPGFEVLPPPAPSGPYAFVGVRPCDLQALAVLDRVFGEGPHADAAYVTVRHAAFVVAVACGSPGGTCFCASMGTGPGLPDDGGDLAVTELAGAGGDPHGGVGFHAAARTARGARVLARVPARPATPADDRAADGVVARAAARMGRAVDASRLPELLASTLEHPAYDDVARRCLACTNCTLVCPTCFCNSTVDVTGLAGAEGEVVRERRWASCFELEHSLLHGGSVRSSVRSRYRQWLTHKLGTWIEQFGTAGCVGCGRCITWCPAAIDLTAEVAALAGDPAPRPAREVSP